MAGLENSVLLAKNVNFDIAALPPHLGIVDAEGKILIGTGQTAPNPEIVANTLTPGAGITITNGAGNITIAASTGGFNWLNIGTSQTLVNQTGYFCSSGGALSLALPATSSVGDTIHVVLDGSTSWSVTQAAGQRIRLGNTVSTTGPGGSVSSNARGDSMTLVCQEANNFWTAIDSVGSLTFV